MKDDYRSRLSIPFFILYRANIEMRKEFGSGYDQRTWFKIVFIYYYTRVLEISQGVPLIIFREYFNIKPSAVSMLLKRVKDQKLVFVMKHNKETVMYLSKQGEAAAKRFLDLAHQCENDLRSKSLAEAANYRSESYKLLIELTYDKINRIRTDQDAHFRKFRADQT